MKLKKCLVIGANGFIGSHLVDELIENNMQVRAFDRYDTPQQFNKNSKIEIFKGDFFDDNSIEAALKDIDYVFHSFSATTPFTSDNDPYTDIEKNILRNVQVFEKIVKSKVKKIIFISSGGAVYGHISEDKRVTELDAPNPVSPYGISKLAVEYYLAYYKQKYGIEYIIYRLTNPYGPRQITNQNQGVIPLFIKKIQESEEITVWGDGSSSRDFIYIRDVTRMIVSSFSENTQHYTYNIGSGIQTDLNSIIVALEKIFKIKAKIKHLDAPKTFLKKTNVSIDRYNNEFGGIQPTDLDNGLKITLNKNQSGNY